MIELHATKKLFAKLPVDKNGGLPSTPNTQGMYENSDISASPLSGWHGNLITLQRRQCILLIHDATRFPVFIPCLTKPDFAALDDRFTNSFMNTLLKINASELHMETAHNLLAPLHIDTNCNRSVQGTMNQMKGDIEHLLWYNDVNVSEITGYRIGSWLANRPCNVKGQKDCIWPEKAMLALIEASADSATEQTQLPHNVVPIGSTHKR